MKKVFLSALLLLLLSTAFVTRAQAQAFDIIGVIMQMDTTTANQLFDETGNLTTEGLHTFINGSGVPGLLFHYFGVDTSGNINGNVNFDPGTLFNGYTPDLDGAPDALLDSLLANLNGNTFGFTPETYTQDSTFLIDFADSLIVNYQNSNTNFHDTVLVDIPTFNVPGQILTQEVDSAGQVTFLVEDLETTLQDSENQNGLGNVGQFLLGLITPDNVEAGVAVSPMGADVTFWGNGYIMPVDKLFTFEIASRRLAGVNNDEPALAPYYQLRATFATEKRDIVSLPENGAPDYETGTFLFSSVFRAGLRWVPDNLINSNIPVKPYGSVGIKVSAYMPSHRENNPTYSNSYTEEIEDGPVGKTTLIAVENTLGVSRRMGQVTSYLEGGFSFGVVKNSGYNGNGRYARAGVIWPNGTHAYASVERDVYAITGDTVRKALNVPVRIGVNLPLSNIGRAIANIVQRL